MYYSVFYRVILQFVDDGGTSVDDGQYHLVGINRISVCYHNQGQIQLVAFLMRLRKVVCVQRSFYKAGFYQRVAKRGRNVFDGGVSSFFQESLNSGVYGRE